MEAKAFETTFESISQRVVFSYIRSLSTCTAVMPVGMLPDHALEVEASQRDLHRFFQELYQALFDQPDVFGLPPGMDEPLSYDDSERGKKLPKINRALDARRKRINQGLDFLRAAGQEGLLQGGNLVFDQEAYSGLIKAAKIGQKFLQGLEGAGLTVNKTSTHVVLSNPRFPGMMPALKMLSHACQQYESENIRQFHFARCDFRALEPGYSVQAMDLFSIFSAQVFERLEALHEFMISMNYKPNCNIYGIFAWEVKYQGDRKIKGSPLFQVEYQERFQNPLRLYIKCASANRIAALIPNQPRLLQEDFHQRAFRCRGSECNWCKDRKGIGPGLLVYEDTRTPICWYVPPDIPQLSDSAIELIKQYVHLHEALLADN
jgi:hypothetical protein